MKKITIEADEEIIKQVKLLLLVFEQGMREGEFKAKDIPDPDMLEDIFVINTQHITESDSNSLTHACGSTSMGYPIAVHDYEYGWIVIQPDSIILADGDAKDSKFPLSEDFWNILKYVKETYPECTRIQFDCDGVVKEEFPKHDW